MDCFRKQFKNLYDNKMCEYPINTSICGLLNNFGKRYMNSEKIYDLVVCCSQLDRKVKNNEFLIKVLNHDQCKNYKKCIIGGKNHKFTDIPNCVCWFIVT